MESFKPAEEVTLYNTPFLKRKLNFEVNEVNKKFPNISWIPKLRKRPTKARFITAAPKCSVKSLSKAVTVTFRLIF